MRKFATRNFGMVKNFPCALLALLLCLLLAQPTTVALAASANGESGENEPTKVVRIGYYNDDPAFQSGSTDADRKSGYAYDYYQGISAVANWEYDYLYGTKQEMIDALNRGDVDIIAGITEPEAAANGMLISDEDMGLEDKAVYFAVSPARPDLIEDLDSAQERILTTSPRFAMELLQKYYSHEIVDQNLTANQKEYLQNKGTLRVGFVNNNLPISGSSSDGEPLGATRVLIEDMRKFIGIEINTQPYNTVEDMLVALQADEIDIAFPVYSDLWVSEVNHLIQTHEVVTERAMVIYKDAYREGITDSIGICEDGLQQHVFVEANYPDSKITSYKTRQEAFEALSRGEVDSVIGASSVLTRFLTDHDEFENFNTAFLDTTQAFSMAVKQSDGMLAGILNKLVNQLEESSITAALVQYASAEGTYSLMGFIRHNAVMVISILAIFFVILLAVFVTYRKKTRAHNREQEYNRMALEGALKAANAANAAKSTFLSSMSHDIRTPMNGIIGMTSIAMANIDDKEKALDSLRKVNVSSKHLLALINDILDMSKIESGEISLNEEVVDLPQLMNELVTVSKPQADAKHQEFDAHVHNLSHEKVIGDSLRIQQVFMNLVGNAIKYTPDGGTIKITMAEVPSVDPKRICLKFTVQDNGIGMSEEFLPHLFEPFSREETATSGVSTQQGTGLGMAIVRNTIRLMEGDIDVQSKLGEGSTFVVTLFLKPCDADELKFEHLRGTRILIVDDDEAVCESACQLLDEMGMHGEYVLSGQAAIDRLLKNKDEDDKFTAAFIDWKMPEMDGVATTSLIRQKVSAEMPLIIISAYDWSDIEEEALSAGANGFIAKPLFKSRIVNLFLELENATQAEDGMTLEEVADDAHFEGKHALMVEDNDLNAEIAIEILGMTGLEIDRAENGQLGVEAFQSHEPGYYDCILMDIQMPVMNGYEATRQIRALDRSDAKSIPIFAMTADAFNDDKQEALEVGMNEHFAKPLDFESVIKVMKTYLNK